MKIDRPKIYADVSDLLSDVDLEPIASRNKLKSLKKIIDNHLPCQIHCNFKYAKIVAMKAQNDSFDSSKNVLALWMSTTENNIRCYETLCLPRNFVNILIPHMIIIYSA